MASRKYEGLSKEEIKEIKKAKRKRRRKIAGRVWLGILGVLVILFIIFHNIILSLAKLLICNYQTEHAKIEYREVALSKEQMLEDFEYLYDAACYSCLTREYAEKYFDVDYDELHDIYRERIENCKDEYEFTAILMSLDAKLPGVHGLVNAPSEKHQADFPMGEYVDKEILTVNYSLWKQFEARMSEYNQKGILASYYDGDYVLRERKFGDFETIEGLDYAKIVSLNGKPVKDVVKELDSLSHWGYDLSEDSVFVKTLFFNDGIGEKYDAEIMLPDGTTIHKDLYVSAEYNTAYYYRSRNYPESHKAPDDAVKTDEDQKTYSIETDPERKLVYARFTQCNKNDTAQINADLTAALAEVDAEYVILDFRDNPGGNYTYVVNGVLPPVLDHDAGVVNHALYPKNEYTQGFYKNGLYRYMRKTKDAGDGKFRTTEEFTVKGEATKSYKIFAFVNHGTVSSGDIFSYIAKQDGITLIGQNTGGEGLSGNPLQTHLPNSKLSLDYVPAISEVYPEDNYLGVVPDYTVKTDWDVIMKRNTLFPEAAESEYGTYENRLKWDPCIQKAIELIEEQ